MAEKRVAPIRGKREDSREGSEKRDGRREKREERRAQGEARREKREERRENVRVLNNSNSTDRVCERPWAGGMAKKRVGPSLAASFGTSGGLLGFVFCLLSCLFSLLSSLFSLLSSLFSLLLAVVVLRGLGPLSSLFSLASE